MSRGVLLTFDSMLAMAFALVIVGASAQYVQGLFRGGWSDVEVVRSCYDIGLALDEMNVWTSDNENQMRDSLTSVTPKNMDLSADVEHYIMLEGAPYLISKKVCGQAPSGDYTTQKIMSSDGAGGYHITRLRMGLR